ncbi:hypothetical protein OROGR_000418 [Orobanche gracilis]
MAQPEMGLEPIWPMRLVRVEAHTTSLSSLAEPTCYL